MANKELLQALADGKEIKPRTITINGREVPEPLRVEPADGMYVWLVRFPHPVKYLWTSGDRDGGWLTLGVLHATRDAAQVHTDALLSCSAQASE